MSDAIRPLSLPAIGFGTYNLRGRAGAQAVTSAIEVGYRLIDSAFSYENEGCVADGVAGAVEAGLACREEIVVTSKVPGRYYGYEQGLAAVEALGHANVTTALVPGAGHDVRRSRPEGFYAAVDPWLAQVLPA